MYFTTKFGTVTSARLLAAPLCQSMAKVWAWLAGCKDRVFEKNRVGLNKVRVGYPQRLTDATPIIRLLMVNCMQNSLTVWSTHHPTRGLTSPVKGSGPSEKGANRANRANIANWLSAANVNCH